MCKYFISFNYITDNGAGFGNTVLESNVKITDFKSVDEMKKWINDVQKWIEETKGCIKNVIVLNFILIN